MTMSSNESFPEKVNVDMHEPLVLRPPVGSHVYSHTSTKWCPFFNCGSCNRYYHHRRGLLLGIFFSLFILLLIIGILISLSMFGLTSISSWIGNKNFQMHPSICRIRIPFLKLNPIELVRSTDSLLNITLSNVPYYDEIHILHLLNERLTVIRTNKHCYIRPLRADLIGPQMMDYLHRLKEGNDLRETVEANVATEPWFVDDNPHVTIQNSLIMAWCAGVPAYHLVSKPPSGGYSVDDIPNYINSPSKQSVMDESLNEVEDIQDPRELLITSLSDQTNLLRPVRSIDLANTLNINSADLPIKTNKRDQIHCRIADVLFEDFTIPTHTQPKTVSIQRDVILNCR